MSSRRAGRPVLPGSLLYELLTGRLPFEDDARHVVPPKHITEPPTPPRLMRAGLPQDPDKVILELPARNPADRPQTATQVRHRLSAMAAAVHRVHIRPARTLPPTQLEPDPPLLPPPLRQRHCASQPRQAPGRRRRRDGRRRRKRRKGQNKRRRRSRPGPPLNRQCPHPRHGRPPRGCRRVGRATHPQHDLPGSDDCGGDAAHPSHDSDDQDSCFIFGPLHWTACEVTPRCAGHAW